jgi:hypothetical protein
MCGSQCADLDGGITLLTLWSYMKELSKLIHRWRKHHLVVRTGRQIENWYPDKLTNDLGINSNDVSINSGLQYRLTLIILRHLQVGIEKSNKPGENNTGAGVEISPLILLDSLIDTIQRRHHSYNAPKFFLTIFLDLKE